MGNHKQLLWTRTTMIYKHDVHSHVAQRVWVQNAPMRVRMSSSASVERWRRSDEIGSDRIGLGMPMLGWGIDARMNIEMQRSRGKD